MRPSAGTLALLLAMSATAAGCGAAEYPLQLVNDLPQAVVVEGCKGCAQGQEVRPGQSVRLTVEEDVVVQVTTADGRVVGCGYVPAGASTSDVVPTRASDLEGLECDSPAGERRRR